MKYENIVLQKEERIATITLNRPDKVNAINPAMNVELTRAIEDITADDNVRVLIFTGAGRGFCAGADIGNQAARIAGQLKRKSRKRICENTLMKSSSINIWIGQDVRNSIFKSYCMTKRFKQHKVVNRMRS